MRKSIYFKLAQLSLYICYILSQTIRTTNYFGRIRFSIWSWKFNLDNGPSRRGRLHVVSLLVSPVSAFSFPVFQIFRNSRSFLFLLLFQVHFHEILGMFHVGLDCGSQIVVRAVIHIGLNDLQNKISSSKKLFLQKMWSSSLQRWTDL